MIALHIPPPAYTSHRAILAHMLTMDYAYDYDYGYAGGVYAMLPMEYAYDYGYLFPMRTPLLVLTTPVSLFGLDLG